MNTDLLGYSSRVRYQCYNKDFGWTTIEEPINWDEDEKEIKRSEKVFGVFTELSNNLEFVGAGYDFIRLIYTTYGVEADIIMIKSERNGDTDEWETRYFGYLDLMTLELMNSENKLKVKFNESAFYKKIKARDSDEFELTRLDTANGKSMDELKIDRVEIQPRRIFITSRLKYDPNQGELKVPHRTIVFGLDYEARAIPWAIDFAGDTLVDPIVGSSIEEVPINNDGDYQTGAAATLFYGINDRYKTVRIRFRVQLSWSVNSFGGDFRVYFELVRYTDGGNYQFDGIVTEFDRVVGEYIKNDHVVEADFYMQLQEGESLGLFIKTVSRHDITFIFDQDNFLSVEEDSYFDPTTANVLLPHEAGERLVEIMTDSKEAFKSDFFGRPDILDANGAPKYPVDGAGALVGMLYGFWIRGFGATPPEIPEDATEEERADIIYEKPITTSFQNWFESYADTFNLGYGIETVAGKERVVVEELEYFFEDAIRISIPDQVSNVKRMPARKYMYSALTFGQKNGADYEEQQGLDEYNVTNKYVTNLIKTDDKFEKETEYRKDSYGIELIRRKQRDKYPTEDTDYDESTFMYDMKRGLNEVFTAVLWQDRFEEEPKNVFSPETAQNLWLSPANTLKRFGWWLKACLQLHPNEYIRYISSNGNSGLVTKLIGEEEVKENGRFQNKTLERNLFKPEWIEFEAPVSEEVRAQVYGSTDGKPNYYGLVTFFNEDNIREYGYLFSLKPDGKGKWKLLKANR